MKTFDELYDELNFEELNKKTTEEHEKVVYFLVGIVVFLFFSMIIFNVSIFENMNSEGQILSAFTPTILIIGLAWKIFHKKSKENPKTYLEIYKEQIITPMIKNCFRTSTYYPKKGLPKEEYNEMEYNEDYNYYKSEDLIEAEINTKNNDKIFMRFSDITVSKIEENKEKNFFKGMIGHIKIDKKIPSYIKITTKNDINKTEQVLMDSTSFEKYFNVESSDKIISMQILTSDIMLNIIDIWNKTNVEFEILIKNNNINLRFFTGNMFESSMDELKIERKKILKKYYDILGFIKQISLQIHDAIDEADI